MKKFMITGGLIGFSIGMGMGLLQRSQWPAVLWRASAAALAAGMMMRWWARLLIDSLRNGSQQQSLLQAKAAHAQTPPSTPKP